MQYRMRVERMMPAHDLRPAFARIQSEMERIKADMAREGEVAYGPGSLALGWGYLFLKQPQRALETLNAGWDSGFQTPGMAYALARTHCDAYEEELPLARAQGEKAIQTLKEHHMVPARHLFEVADSEGLEPSDLGKARLETLDGDPGKALAFADRALQTNPDAYEADAWKAEALNDIGFGFQKEGNYAKAEQIYRQSDQAAIAAQTIGRSDEWALKVQLNRQLASVAIAEWQDKVFDLKSTAKLSDDLLALNPDWLPAIADRLTVSWRRAEILLNAGQDPRPVASEGWSRLEATGRIPGAIPRLQRDRLNLARILATYEFKHGRDPRAWISKGLAGSRDDEYAADLLILRARWEISHHIDPTADLERAIAGCQRPTFESPTSAGVLATIGDAWLEKAKWLKDSGQNAEAALSKAKNSFTTAKAVNPMNRASHAGLREVSALERQMQKSPTSI